MVMGNRLPLERDTEPPFLHEPPRLPAIEREVPVICIFFPF